MIRQIAPVLDLVLLQRPDIVALSGLSPLRNVHSVVGPRIDHRKVELVRVAGRGLFFELFNPLLFAVEVAGAQHIVLVLLEEPELRPRRGLRTLLVRPLRNRFPATERLLPRCSIALG